MNKFKIEDLQEEYVFRNIRFNKELFEKINSVKGDIPFIKFVVEAVKFALDNMED